MLNPEKDSKKRILLQVFTRNVKKVGRYKFSYVYKLLGTITFLSMIEKQFN